MSQVEENANDEEMKIPDLRSEGFSPRGANLRQMQMLNRPLAPIDDLDILGDLDALDFESA